MPPFGKWNLVFYLEANRRQAIIVFISRPKQESLPTPPREKLRICWTTVENEHDAQTIANALVDEGLAACVQIDGPIESLYIWEGKRCQSTEYRLWIKVLETHLSAARERVKSLHSYETPQWIEVEAIKVDEKYLNWAKEASNLRGFQKPEPI